MSIPKISLQDLAIFGGPVMFHDKRYVGCPNIGNRERLYERIDDILALSKNKFTVLWRMFGQQQDGAEGA